MRVNIITNYKVYEGQMILESFDINMIKEYKDKIKTYLKDLNESEVVYYLKSFIGKIENKPKKIRQLMLMSIVPLFMLYISNKTIEHSVGSVSPSIKTEMVESGILSKVNDKVVDAFDNKYGKGYKYKLSQEGWDLIKSHEKLKLTAYDIGDGMITIGWGHAKPKGESKYKVGDKITKEKAQQLIQKDMKEKADAIRRIFKEWDKQGIDVEITQNQFDVLVSLAFNAGQGSVRMSEFIQDIKKGDLKSAAEKIKTFNIDDKKFPGLRKRRLEEYKLFIKDL
jgi:lysozyme